MPEEAEAGHVGGTTHPCSNGDPCRIVIQTRHGGERSIDHHVCGGAELDGRRDHPHAERLREDDRITGSEPVVREHPVRMHLADHGQAELGFRVIHGVASSYDEPALCGDLLGAEEHLAQEIVRQLGGVPADQVECQQGSAAHRVDVRHGIGRGYAAPPSGVIHNRSNEVGCHDHGAVVVEAPHGGVVAGRCSDQEVGICHWCQAAHDVRQLAGGELAASTSAVAELCQPSGLVHLVTPVRVVGTS